jgi:ketosteroid isomerase-like protein
MTPKDVAKRFIEFAERMDSLSALNMLAEDGRYIVIGTTQISRTYNGRKDLVESLGPVFSTFIELPVLTFQEPIVDGNRAVLLAKGVGKGPTGPYKQPYYAFVTTVRGEEFAEIIEFMDTGMMETALFGKKLVTA